MDPTRPMTKSNRGTDSARITPKATILDLIRQRWKQKSETKYANINKNLLQPVALPAGIVFNYPKGTA